MIYFQKLTLAYNGKVLQANFHKFHLPKVFPNSPFAVFPYVATCLKMFCITEKKKNAVLLVFKFIQKHKLILLSFQRNILPHECA